jgi:peptidoglycan/LPS O-acetylase OafA/YrhL
MVVMYCLYRFGGYGAYGFWWYNSVIAFPLGMWYCRYRESIHALIQKKYPLWMTGAAAGFAAVYWWICPRHNDGTLPVLLMQILCVILFCGVLVLLSQKVHFSNPILRFLGDHSLEIYLWHALFIAIFRSLSRNIYKRYEENRKFLVFFQKLKDKDHRYYNCPRCRQQVRVPKGKGKISITCPKCREKFIKTT